MATLAVASGRPLGVSTGAYPCPSPISITASVPALSRGTANLEEVVAYRLKGLPDHARDHAGIPESGGHLEQDIEHAVRGARATMVHGDRQTSTSLRYKHGRNLRCDTKDTLLIDKPEEYGLPTAGLGSNFIIAKEDFYFVYPTNYNEYQRQYRGSFQHGGISLEEMILPVVTLESR